jgi:hypothetical protein
LHPTKQEKLPDGRNTLRSRLEGEMKVSEKFSEWMDRYWTVLVIIFGIAFTLFLALFKPHTDLANY